MLAPTSAHPQYATWRPGLALAPGEGTPLTEDPTLRWHPSLAGLAELYGEGRTTVPGLLIDLRVSGAELIPPATAMMKAMIAASNIQRLLQYS